MSHVTASLLGPRTGTDHDGGSTVLVRREAGRHVRAVPAPAVPETGSVVLRGTEYHVRLGPAERQRLTVPRPVLESHLAGLLGSPVCEPLAFEDRFDLDDPGVRALARALLLQHAEQGRAGVSVAERAHLERYVLTTLLHAVPHQYSGRLRDGSEARRLGRLAPVVAYVEEHADTTLTPELLARVGCVSVRTLHASFAEQVGESPMAYVRRVRLSRVRAELLGADAATSRVTDVAVRWGFFHQSRFAQQYRAHFGELPSVTLARNSPRGARSG